MNIPILEWVVKLIFLAIVMVALTTIIHVRIFATVETTELEMDLLARELLQDVAYVDEVSGRVYPFTVDLYAFNTSDVLTSRNDFAVRLSLSPLQEIHYVIPEREASVAIFNLFESFLIDDRVKQKTYRWPVTIYNTTYVGPGELVLSVVMEE